MSKPILVTGSTGKTGTPVVTELLARGASVRALVRRHDERSARLAKAGAEVVVGDLFDYEQLTRAMRGASSAYFIPPWHSHAIDSAVAFAAAARASGLEAIVELSQWLSSPEHPSAYTRQHWLINKMFASTQGLAHVTINPGLFMDNLLITDVLRMAVHFGLYVVPFSRTMQNAPPSNEDIARVAVAALLDPQRYAGKAYRPTSATLISADEIVSTLSHVFGRAIRPIHNIPEPLFLRALAASGYGPAQRADTRWYFRETNVWPVNAPNTVVRDLTGREPEDFETVARRYAANPALRRTSGNFLSAAGYSLRMMFAAPGNPDGYAAAHSAPRSAATQLSGDSILWRSEHGAHTTTTSLHAVA